MPSAVVAAKMLSRSRLDSSSRVAVAAICCSERNCEVRLWSRSLAASATFRTRSRKVARKLMSVASNMNVMILNASLELWTDKVPKGGKNMRSARIALNAVASRPAHRPPIQPAPTTAPKNSRNGARSVDIQEERKTLTHTATAGHRMPAERALIQGRLFAGNREMMCRIEAISRTLSVDHSIRYFILQLNRLLHNS